MGAPTTINTVIPLQRKIRASFRINYYYNNKFEHLTLTERKSDAHPKMKIREISESRKFPGCRCGMRTHSYDKNFAAPLRNSTAISQKYPWTTNIIYSKNHQFLEVTKGYPHQLLRSCFDVSSYVQFSTDSADCANTILASLNDISLHKGDWSDLSDPMIHICQKSISQPPAKVIGKVITDHSSWR
ncbi:hypothetical protein NPIL_6571 [Nephila pilipes]|uniref:Uncharacterized protein n=1 Tax=Nephila pilipes TaxID=299642 RepID=A0A8X6Q8S4_NEPPI|nr:hypothetical protein NPIL_6571 [Nephila pilipes]